MNTVCFTSFTFSYLAKARVLARTVKKHHPEWHLVAIMTDKAPPGMEFSPEQELFDTVLYSDDFIGPDFNSWIFGHNVVEACTAVKGPAIPYLFETYNADKIIYIDPDIALMNSLAPIEELLDQYSIVLTPHQVDPDSAELAIFDNEVSSLRHGTYNLGFLAVRNDGEVRRFGKWWSDRLLKYCHDDLQRGIFVDQKWCDLVPAFFDNVRILRDPGYNCASWNLSQRKLSFSNDGTLLVNGRFPARFFHFTKLGIVGDIMTQRYALDNVEVYEVWKWYKSLVDEASDARIPNRYWTYANYENGDPITDAHRKLYRSRSDLRAAFPEPFEVSETSFHSWLQHNHIVSH